MSKTNDIQLRGHCQCCGNEQAVVRRLMSKHGYNVKHGWFQGVCQGEFYRPVEETRVTADEIIAQIDREIAVLAQEIEFLQAGTMKPKEAASGRRVRHPTKALWVDEMIPFDEAWELYQRDAVDGAIYDRQFRIRRGQAFAAHLQEVADKYHGQPLIEVRRQEKAPPVWGEKRVLPNGRIAEEGHNGYSNRGRVTYSWVLEKADGTKVRKQGYTSHAAWRSWPLAPG